MAVSCWFSKGWNISLEEIFNNILPNNTNYSFVWILWGSSYQKVLPDQGFNELKPQTYGSPFYLFVSWAEAWRWSCLIGVRNLNLPHLKAQREVLRNRIQLLFGSFIGGYYMTMMGSETDFTLIFSKPTANTTQLLQKSWNSPSCTVSQKLCSTRCHLTQQREELRHLQSLERRMSSTPNYGYLDLSEAEGCFGSWFFLLKITLKQVLVI